jgi:hypothetical protein
VSDTPTARETVAASIGLGEFREIIARLDALKEAGREAPPEKIPLIDPTANVLSLVKAAMERQDDLRNSERMRTDDLRNQQVRYDTAIQVLIDRERGLQFQSLKDLASAESKRIDAIALAESRRIDALLAAATQAVALASEKAAAQAATLATQVATSAEALRAQVAATAASTGTLITQLRESLEKRLTSVEQNQYQQGGATAQRTEGRDRTQWSIGLVIAIFLGLVDLAAILWKSR